MCRIYFYESRIKRNSFTLIELLVVVAIIAVLVAVLLPALSQARQYAKTVQCESHLRQCGTAITFYGTDYDEWWAEWIYSQGHYRYVWWEMLMKKHNYLKSRDVTLCPVWDPVNSQAATSDYQCYGARYWESSTQPASYLKHIYGSGSSNWNYVNMKKIQYPSRYFLLSDSIHTHNYRQTHAVQFYVGSTAIHLRHRNSAAMAFSDGHASLCSGQQIVEDAMFEMPNDTLIRAMDSTMEIVPLNP